MADGIAALLSREPDFDVTALVSWHEVLEGVAGPYDVVVLDLQLGDGIRIGPKVRALAAMGSATVVISRHTDAAAVDAALRAGAHAFVPKTDDQPALVAAIRATAASPELLGDDADDDDLPALGRQEERALTLYASGRSIREVAATMETTEETVKSYIKRSRRKFRESGVDLGTRDLLRAYAQASGWHLRE